MTSDHINWSTLKAISAFITQNIFNVFFFLMEGGPKICPTFDDNLLFKKGPQTWQCLIKVYVIEK